MKKKVFFIGLAIVVLSLGTVWAQPDMKPGKWEITTKMEMGGMPPQTIKHVQCLTAEDMVPVQRESEHQECKTMDVVEKGNTITWKMVCEGEGSKMEGDGKVTYSEDSMNGTVNMTMNIEGGNTMHVKNVMTGKRLGKCDGSEPTTTLNSQPLPSIDMSNLPDMPDEEMEDDEAADAEEVKESVKGLFKGLFK